MTKKISNIIGLFALLAFVFLIGGTLAYWRIEGTSGVTLETGKLKGTLINEYEAESTLSPGTSLDQVIGVVNNGDLDMVVRLKVDKKWENKELSPDMLKVQFNSKYWIEDQNGYYYYKEILAPGQTAKEPLVESIMLDTEAANEYKNQQGDINVTMECLQATSGALSIWDKSYADLGVEEPKTEAAVAGNVVFKADKNFEFTPSPNEVMPYFSELTPGEVRTQTLEVENQYEKKVNFFLTLDNVEAQDSKVQEMLQKYAKIKLTDVNGKELYNGAVWSEGGQEIELAALEKGKTTTVIAMVYLDSEMENEYQGLKAEVQWRFIAQGDEDVAEDVGEGVQKNPGKLGSATTGLPKTGDSYGILIAVGILLILVLLTIAYLAYKERHQKRISADREG